MWKSLCLTFVLMNGNLHAQITDEVHGNTENVLHMRIYRDAQPGQDPDEDQGKLIVDEVVLRDQAER